MTQLIPRQSVPLLAAPLVPEGHWTLNAEQPKHFTLLVFYRGLHCPICKKSLEQLNGLVEDFAAQGVDVLALSCDSRERAEQTRADWKIERLPLAYGLRIDQARRWGLFISNAKPDSDEPERFSEPGVFLVRPDGSLYMSAVNSMPFARPHFDEILDAIRFILKNDYPARGEA